MRRLILIYLSITKKHTRKAFESKNLFHCQRGFIAFGVSFSYDHYIFRLCAFLFLYLYCVSLFHCPLLRSHINTMVNRFLYLFSLRLCSGRNHSTKMEVTCTARRSSVLLHTEGPSFKCYTTRNQNFASPLWISERVTPRVKKTRRVKWNHGLVLSF